jgi:hypothetical protein
MEGMRMAKLPNYYKVIVDGLNVKLEPIYEEMVQVVRCKDCRHLEITGCYGECKRGYMGIVKPWDFCSYGERRD